LVFPICNALKEQIQNKNLTGLYSTVSLICWKMKSSGNLKQKVSKKLSKLKALRSAIQNKFCIAFAETCFSRLRPLRSKNLRSVG